MANKLNIINGIIQDKTIAGFPVIQKIVLGSGAKNVRTGLKIAPNALCYHNTANTSPTADALNHARYLQNLENADITYLSVHLFVDDNKIVQTLPLNEMAYHAGNTIGNKTSISIEICENGNTWQAEKIAQELGASLILTYPALAIKKHQDYSGKYCPRVILNRGGWDKFKSDIIALTKIAVKPALTIKTITLPQGYYIIASRLSGKVLSQVGETVKANNLTGFNNQIWDWNGLNFTNRSSGKRLDISGGDLIQGKPAIVYPAHNGENQQFFIGENGEIVAKHSNYMLDLKNSDQASGAEVIQWAFHNGINQKWYFIKIG